MVAWQYDKSPNVVPNDIIHIELISFKIGTFNSFHLEIQRFKIYVLHTIKIYAFHSFSYHSILFQLQSIENVHVFQQTGLLCD